MMSRLRPKWPAIQWRSSDPAGLALLCFWHSGRPSLRNVITPLPNIGNRILSDIKFNWRFWCKNQFRRSDERNQELEGLVQNWLPTSVSLIHNTKDSSQKTIQNENTKQQIQYKRQYRLQKKNSVTFNSKERKWYKIQHSRRNTLQKQKWLPWSVTVRCEVH